MSAKMSIVIRCALLGGLLSAGCARPYAAPTMNQPHAILKLRRTYRSTAGTDLSEAALIEGRRAFAATDPRSSAGAARTDAILVHPTTAEVRVRAEFFHTESVTEDESYTESVPYSDTESYDCGTSRSPQTCSRSVTKYRSETKYRRVTKTVTMSDGSCSEALWIRPVDGGAYILEFDYAEAGSCRLVCFAQSAGAEAGTFVTTPCTVPSEEERRKARSAR